MNPNLHEAEGIYLDFLTVYESATKLMHQCGAKGENPIQFVNDLLKNSGSDLFLERLQFQKVFHTTVGKVCAIGPE